MKRGNPVGAALIIIGAELAMAASFGVAGIIGWSGHAQAAVSSQSVTVDGTDYPLCGVEDCSDQPNRVGVWRDSDTGTDYLIIGESTFRVTP